MVTKAFSYLRMSTEQQLKGDSLRRQLEASRKYAEAHGLLLVESLQDIGVSAFRGANRLTGALKGFLDLVEEGKVERGSRLLIESFDRLSREQVTKALPQFLSLVSAGIVVVTLNDGKVYDESMHELDLFYSLISMSRSHEESRVKSERVKAAWENKRRRMLETPMTARCPGWLRLNKETGKFEEIPERVAVVRRIFAETLSGLGRQTISKRLNQDAIPPFSGYGQGWHPGTVQKVRHNPAVMGYLPPNKNRHVDASLEEGVPGYYPAIISAEDFHRAQAVVRGRRRTGGPRGKRFSNLFQHIAFCGVCGAKMSMNSNQKRNIKTYICDSSLRGLGCDHYLHHSGHWLEDAFFQGTFFSVDYSRFDAGSDDETRLSKACDDLETTLEAKRRQAELLLDKFGTSPELDLVVERVKKLSQEIKVAEEELVHARRDLSRIRHDGLSVAKRMEILAGLAAELANAGQDQAFRIRASIAQQLKSVVSKVLFFPKHRVQVHIGNGMYHEMRVLNGRRFWYVVV